MSCFDGKNVSNAIFTSDGSRLSFPVTAYRTELNRVYGQMRCGELLPEVATKMAYVLCQGASLARIEQELREAALIREQLVKLNGAGTLELLPASPEIPAVDPMILLREE